MNKYLDQISHKGLRDLVRKVCERDPNETEFLDAVFELAISLTPLFNGNDELLTQFESLCEPDRTVIFRVPWLDDNNKLRINRGMRVQFSSAIGPYKGGLRFHPTFRLSIAKMLAFEQCFKNALTGLALGAGKGGSDFDPKGKSDGEIQRFCISYMTELVRYIDYDIDVPAGDIGVGTREIGYLFGQYKRMTHRFAPGVLTGKGIGWGGSWCRPEATGFGAVFIAEESLKDVGNGDTLKGKKCLVSGSGNVALHCALKLAQSQAIVCTLSDSNGCLYARDGFTESQIREIMELKSDHNGRLSAFKTDESTGLKYFGDRMRPWQAPDVEHLDIAFPCATQNELDDKDAATLIERGCSMVVEGANMPSTAAATEIFHKHKIVFIPGKMANAGGVAVSGLEMEQNKAMLTFSADEVIQRLHQIMKSIYQQAKMHAEKYNTNLGSGANIAAFLKITTAMRELGAC